MKNVLLAGSSGLVGGLALKKLLDDPMVEKIILVSRTRQEHLNPKIIQIITSLDLLDLVDINSFGVNRIDVGLCALGSTIKKAGSREEFKKVDKDFVLNTARFAKKFGARAFSVVSALGANGRSPVFYNQVKGEMENGLRELNFDQLTIIRPSLILGERTEVRRAEKFFIKLSPLLNATLVGPLRKYRGIEAHVIARHLAGSVTSNFLGVTVIENAEMLTI